MRVGIIGGGASGMILASKLKNKDVTILERNSKLGKKLLLTGNGKCNFTNMDFDDITNIYNNNFAINVFRKYDNCSFIEYFKEIGIVPKVEVHKVIRYLYPNSNKSTSVYYNLLDRIVSNGVKIEYDSCVKDIQVKGDEFIVTCESLKTYVFDKLVLSTGGKSYKNTGSDGKGYELAKILGHNIKNVYPGLCALKFEDKDLKNLKGIRVEVKISVHNDIVDFDEIGEIQFTEFGLSGIPVMNLSSKLSGHLSKTIQINLNFAIMIDKDINIEELVDYLKERQKSLTYKKVEDFLCGFLSNELGEVIIARSNVRSKNTNELSEEDIKSIANNIINFKIGISGTADFDNAQITIGGVDVDEISPNTLESKLIKNLYFTGEIIDIDGRCGGYNLQLAYSTASIVADSI